MAENDDKTRGLRISNEFQERLSRLKPGQMVQAIVLLQVKKDRSLRPTRENRQATLEAVRKSASASLSGIDKVLSEHGGRRLTEGVSALGSIPVETTAEGIFALATLDQVKAVLEDQSIMSLPKLKQA
jgi:hypothetical protein